MVEAAVAQYGQSLLDSPYTMIGTVSIGRTAVVSLRPKEWLFDRCLNWCTSSMPYVPTVAPTSLLFYYLHQGFLILFPRQARSLTTGYAFGNRICCLPFSRRESLSGVICGFIVFSSRHGLSIFTTLHRHTIKLISHQASRTGEIVAVARNEETEKKP